MTQLISAVAVLLLVILYVSWTASRLDRLIARATAAWAVLDAQLVRRAAAAGQLAAYERRHGGLADQQLRATEYAASAARSAPPGGRQDAENDLTRALRAALAEGALMGNRADVLFDDVCDASTKVDLARQFYNDAVRDNNGVRRRLLCRLLCSFRSDPAFAYFEIADAAIGVERNRSVVPDAVGG